MARRTQDSNTQFAPAINIAHVGELNVYVVHEHELDKLAEGSPSTLAFNAAVALLSLAVGFLLSVTTTTINQSWLFQTYLFTCINFFLVGTVLLVYWWRTKSSVREVVNNIKSRMRPLPGSQEAMPSPPPTLGSPD